MEVLNLDEKDLFQQMSSEQKYKYSSAAYRLQLFKKRESRLTHVKEEFLQGRDSSRSPPPHLCLALPHAPFSPVIQESRVWDGH